jgi:hypothetical protein
MTDAPPFICPICQRKSWHPRDAKERFCAACGFVDDVLLKTTEGSSVIPLSRRRVAMSDYAQLQRPGSPASVSSINDARPPVWYDVAVCHHYDGTIQTWVKAVGLDDPEDRKKIAIALRQAADGLEDMQNVQ